MFSAVENYIVFNKSNKYTRKHSYFKFVYQVLPIEFNFLNLLLQKNMN